MFNEQQLQILEALLKHNSTGLKTFELSNILRCDNSSTKKLLYGSSIGKYLGWKSGHIWCIADDKIVDVQNIINVYRGCKNSSSKNNPPAIDNRKKLDLSKPIDTPPKEDTIVVDGRIFKSRYEANVYLFDKAFFPNKVSKKESSPLLLKSIEKQTPSFSSHFEYSYSLFDTFKRMFLNDDELIEIVNKFQSPTQFLDFAAIGFKGYSYIRNDEYILAALTAFADFWDEIRNIGYSRYNLTQYLFCELLTHKSNDSQYIKSVNKRREDYYKAEKAKYLIRTYLDKYDALVQFDDILNYLNSIPYYQGIDDSILRMVLMNDNVFVTPNKGTQFQLADKPIIIGDIPLVAKKILEKEEKPLHISELITKVLALRPNSSRKNINSAIHREIDNGIFCLLNQSFVGIPEIEYASEYLDDDNQLDANCNEGIFRCNLAEYKKYIENNKHIPFHQNYDDNQRFLYNWFYRMSHNLDLPIHLKTELYLIRQDIEKNHIAVTAEEFEFQSHCENYQKLLMKYGRIIDNDISEEYCQWFNDSLIVYDSKSDNIKFYFTELLEILKDFGYML